MTAIDEVFRRLRASGQKAFMPFVTAGDPDLDFTLELIRELGRRGCHLCELGIPYSDPIADGPVIQASYTRALNQGIKLESIFARLRDCRDEDLPPRVAMASYAIILRKGPAAFVEQAVQAGVSGVIVPDLPLEEAQLVSQLCRERSFDLIQLVTPNTSLDRALRIAETSSGFLYYVSVTGITGERRELPEDLVSNVARLRERIDLPLCIGFGIHAPEHVRLLAPVADGLIVGSAIVRRVASSQDVGRTETLQEVGNYAATMLAALNDADAAS